MPHLPFKSSVVCLAFYLCFLSGFPLYANEPPTLLEDGGGYSQEHVPHLTDEQRHQIEQQLTDNLKAMPTQDFPGGGSPVAPSFIWPVRKASHVKDYNVDAVSNYVDQDLSNPNSLLDYYCGARTYDVPGYNHKGIDIFTWPFSWHKMNDNDAEIVAAAPGVILGKDDGNDDKSCSTSGGNWNAVYVLHADGSVAWYGHMKKNSLTSKSVGESVVTGEYLGIVGSSGNSTGPHLHLEVYDSQGNLIDPYSGACNFMNANSWWENQPDYYEPQINMIETGSAAVNFNSCPTPADKNFEDTFFYGDPIYFSVFYRDRLSSNAAVHKITQPDGTVYASWNHSSSTAHHSASWYYWTYENFYGSQTGIWQWSADFESSKYTKRFFIVDSCVNDFVVPAQSRSGIITYGASNTISTSENTITVNQGGTMNLLAKQSVSLGSSFSVAKGGVLKIDIVPVCD